MVIDKASAGLGRLLRSRASEEGEGGGVSGIRLIENMNAFMALWMKDSVVKGLWGL